MTDSGVSIGLLVWEGIFLFIKLWALLAALRRPEWAFAAANRSKGFWVTVLVIGLFVPCLGGLLAAGYLFFTDTKVRAEQQLGRGPGFPGGPPLY